MPLAAGPSDSSGTWLQAVHGEHAAWVRNLIADPRVRVRHRGRWRAGTASVHAPDQPAPRFGTYARGGPLLFGSEPRVVRVIWARSPEAGD